MTGPDPNPPSDITASSVAEISGRFRAQTLAGQAPKVDDFLVQVPEPIRPILQRELLEIEREFHSGTIAPIDEFRTRAPFSDLVVVSDGDVDQTRMTLGSADMADWDSIDQATDPSGPAPPRVLPVVPGYEILGVLGRGGMGVVYKARSIRLGRVVALKMILWGDHSTADMVLRFLSEGEAAARLQHPNIVQIYHVGDLAGMPFLELEYLEGGGLDRKIDGTPWPPRVAAELMATIADAIAAAHQAGIIHRDLKPANILLDGAGSPKVSDFGLARRVGVGQNLTATGVVLGTPAYMAPEQAEGRTREVGPPADVHSLGAILYELLTGRSPFRGTTLFQTLELVRSAEPVSPSRLVPNIPRDLVTICLKSLQKDLSRRYPTARELRDDLRLFLEGRPVQARPSTAAERSWRWCRRNPVVASLASSIVGLMIVGLVLATSAAFRFRQLAEQAESRRIYAELAGSRARESEGIARDQRSRAVAEAGRARSTADFLVKLFESADPLALDSLSLGERGKMGAALTARDVVDRGAARLTGAVDDPELRVTLLEAVGNAYLGMGEVDKAEPILSEALVIRKRVQGPEDALLAATMHSLAFARLLRGDGDEAVAGFQEALQSRRRLLAPDDLRLANTMFCLALAIHQSESRDFLDEADHLLTEALAIQRKSAGPRSREVAMTSLMKAFFRMSETNPLVAAKEITEATRIVEEVEGKQGLGQALTDFLVGRAQEQVGWDRLSAANYGKAVAELIPILGPRHPIVGFGKYYQGKSYLKAHLLDQAAKTLEEALEVFRGGLGASHPVISVVLIEQARVLRDLGQLPRAEATLKQAIDIGREKKHPRTAELSRALFIYATLLDRRNATGEALEIQREAIKTDLATGFDTTPYSTAKLGTYLYFLEATKAGTEADIDQFRRAVEARQKLRKPNDPDAGHDRFQLARLLEIQGHPAEARQTYQQSLELFEAAGASLNNDQKTARDQARQRSKP